MLDLATMPSCKGLPRHCHWRCLTTYRKHCQWSRTSAEPINWMRCVCVEGFSDSLGLYYYIISFKRYKIHTHLTWNDNHKLFKVFRFCFCSKLLHRQSLGATEGLHSMRLLRAMRLLRLMRLLRVGKLKQVQHWALQRDCMKLFCLSHASLANCCVLLHVISLLETAAGVLAGFRNFGQSLHISLLFDDYEGTSVHRSRHSK